MDNSIITRVVSESLQQLTFDKRNVAIEHIYSWIKHPENPDFVYSVVDSLPQHIRLCNAGDEVLHYNHAVMKNEESGINEWVVWKPGEYHSLDCLDALKAVSALTIPDHLEVCEEIKRREKFLSSIMKMKKCVKFLDPESLTTTHGFLAIIEAECQSSLLRLYYNELLHDGLALLLSPKARGKLIGICESMRE